MEEQGQHQDQNKNVIVDYKKIVKTGLKVDFHIHSIASKYKDGRRVDKSTIENIETLIKQLNRQGINMCAISDHDNFDYELYKRLKLEENSGSIKKVFPAVEFSVVYDNSVLHVITVFNDEDEEKIKSIQNELFDTNKNAPLYDKEEKHAFSEEAFLSILRKINIDVIMIAHQKETLSSRIVRNHDAKTVGNEKFAELVFLDYFEAFEFKNKRNEIFNKYYIEKNKEKYGDNTLRFITGSDCHEWNRYPEEDETFSFTYLKCLPTFRGLAMAVTNTKRINYINNFFSNSTKCLNEIDIKIDAQEYHIPLSKGINVIIGDNSIGKSLMIHKLTDYKFLRDEKLKNSYEEYLKNKNTEIKSIIPKEIISKFDGQGAIRAMFENKTFDADGFINGFFPGDPLIGKFKEQYFDEVEKYISVLKNKYELSISEAQLGKITIQNISASSKTLKLKKIPQITINSVNSTINKIGKEIVGNFESIIAILEKIYESKHFEPMDMETVRSSIETYDELIKKYNKKITKKKEEIARINLINTVFDHKNKEFSRTKTDESENISNYEDEKNIFETNMIDYYSKNRNLLSYSPNIGKSLLPINANSIGEYRFVARPNTKEVSNEDIINMIGSTLGKNINDINEVNEDNLPAKFDTRGNKELSYYDRLELLKTELHSKISEKFKVEHLINDANDKDISHELSAGFNSKIYFDLISNQTVENGIYIIDQPEDDVSQPSIRNNLLEDFYNMSKNRQIIIITHNPQFIVNLDVDNVIFIGKDADGKLYIQNGALEYYDEQYSVLNIVADNIEGGVESINERWKRYDKNIYNVPQK